VNGINEISINSDKSLINPNSLKEFNSLNENIAENIKIIRNMEKESVECFYMNNSELEQKSKLYFCADSHIERFVEANNQLLKDSNSFHTNIIKEIHKSCGELNQALNNSITINDNKWTDVEDLILKEGKGTIFYNELLKIKGNDEINKRKIYLGINSIN